MSRVLVVATSRKTRGGITSVIKAHETGEQWKKFHCHWIQTHRDGPAWRKILYLLWAWIDYIVRLPFYDIVHVHFSLRVTALRKQPFIKLAKMMGKKVVAHLHCGSQIDEIWNDNYDYIFRNADVSLFLSERLKKTVERHVGKNYDFRVCYNPCPKVSLEPIMKKQNNILFSGTLYKGKGYADLIKAFSHIAYKYPDWKVVFAGNGEIEQGRNLAHNLNIVNQVVFLDWVAGDAKDKAFREASIFCLPSYAEGFPMAVLDAWAYGLPVITTPVGGIPDIADDGNNLLLFNPGDIDTLAYKLDEIISNNELRQRIAQESLNFEKNTFNVDTINSKLCEIYDELVK